jgi:hypothetical protein
MKKSDTRSKLTLILFIFTAMVLLAGCSGSIEKGVVGKWIQTDKPGYIEFSANKSLVLNDGKSVFTGSWSVVDKKQLKFQIMAMGKQQNVIWDKVNIKGDNMTITLGSMEYNFKRSK